MLSAQSLIRVGLSLLALLLINACASPNGKTLSVYHIEKSGASRDAANILGQSLNLDKAVIDDKKFIDAHGRIYFINPELHQSAPSKRIAKGKPDEDEQPVVVEALDLEALKSLIILDEGKAQERYLNALKKAGLLPRDSKPRVTHGRLIVVDKSGELLADAALNTRVLLDNRVGDYPLEGPGSKLSVSFDGHGNVTKLKHASRQLSRGEKVTVITENQASQRCADAFMQAAPKGGYDELKVRTRLFYYAPPLSVKGAHTIIPYYECSGSAVMEKQRVEFLQQLIPAIKDVKYVPHLKVSTTVKGAKVEAIAHIQGGTPPYEIQWSSSGTVLEESGERIAYSVARRKDEVAEVLNLRVVDSNGVFVSVSKPLQIDSTAVMQVIDFAIPRVAGVRDFGTENSVIDQFGALEQGFIDQMVDDGVVKRFTWRGINAWEQDFKESEDSQWIDNTDITFYVGHGNVGVFTFEDTTHDDAILDNNDATEDWGDKDLEWLALYSCQVLGKGDDGMAPFDNWSQEFDGLHLLLGFHTNAQVNSSFSGAFASELVDSRLKVRQAWFEAIDEHQSNDRVGVVMGVYRSGSWAWNYDDYFHGKGNVGPDIRDSDIGGYWYTSGP